MLSRQTSSPSYRVSAIISNKKHVLDCLQYLTTTRQTYESEVCMFSLCKILKAPSRLFFFNCGLDSEAVNNLRSYKSKLFISVISTIFDITNSNLLSWAVITVLLFILSIISTRTTSRTRKRVGIVRSSLWQWKHLNLAEPNRFDVQEDFETIILICSPI